MIATILPGSSNFHAVGYNEHKVSKGVARLIEIQNFGSLGTFHKPTPSELVGYLQKYSSQNSRIRKPQFHVAISCKGHDMSEEELLDFAHQYLKEMGYGESGQPLLVYSHYDTENTHLHIIYFDDQSRPLKPFMAEAIDRNNRIAMVEMFSPATEAERDLLCKIFKVSRTDLVDISPERTQYHTDAVNRLREIFNDETVTSIRRQLHEEGFTICHDEDATYAINFKQHIIINLTEENFNLQRLKEQRMKQIERYKPQQPTKPTSRFSGKAKLRDAGGGSHSEKREWEVGQKGNYDNVDDERSIKR